MAKAKCSVAHRLLVLETLNLRDAQVTSICVGAEHDAAALVGFKAVTTKSTITLITTVFCALGSMCEAILA